MQMPAKSQQGFTLVELLIVVAIIGILAAIAIPQFTQYREDARISAVEGELRTCLSENSAEFAADGELGDNSACQIQGDEQSTTVNFTVDGGSITLESDGELDTVNGWFDDGSFNFDGRRFSYKEDEEDE